MYVWTLTVKTCFMVKTPCSMCILSREPQSYSVSTSKTLLAGLAGSRSHKRTLLEAQQTRKLKVWTQRKAHTVSTPSPGFQPSSATLLTGQPSDIARECVGMSSGGVRIDRSTLPELLRAVTEAIQMSGIHCIHS